MAAFSELYTQVRLYCKGVPDITIDDALRLSAREFCRKTWYCTRTIDVVTTPGQAFYDIAPVDDDNEQIVGIKAVEGEKILLPAKQESIKYEVGQPCVYIYLPPSTIELLPYPKPTETNLPEYRVRIAVTVTSNATILPDDLFPDFEQAIAYGAIKYICSMPGENWSNDDKAKMAEMKFVEGMRHAKTKAVFGHQHWNNQVSSGRFAV